MGCPSGNNNKKNKLIILIFAKPGEGKGHCNYSMYKGALNFLFLFTKNWYFFFQRNKMYSLTETLKIFKFMKWLSFCPDLNLIKHIEIILKKIKLKKTNSLSGSKHQKLKRFDQLVEYLFFNSCMNLGMQLIKIWLNRSSLI